MRLTLRTLLAYLDDTLDATQVKKIGQKVAESDTAQELIARIKQVTRRRRLTVPPATGPGAKLDANTIAEYLENELSEDEVAEVEQICLGSDVHLAEMAACHQLLTLILGEPILIPPTSKQRMYGLVKGREAIPFRKPPTDSSGESQESKEEKYEVDETLRMGLPALRRNSSWASRLTLIGGALAASLLLIFAIVQALKTPEDSLTDKSKTQLAANTSTEAGKQSKGPGTDKHGGGVQPSTEKSPTNGGKTEDGTKTSKTKTEGPGVPKPPISTGKNGKKTGKETDNGKKKKNGKNGKGTKTPSNEFRQVPIDAPKNDVRVIGQYAKSMDNSPSLLLQKPNDGPWQVIDALNRDVKSGLRLVSMPGYHGAVLLPEKGLRLNMLGVIQEEEPQPVLVRESMVHLHHHKDLDLDLTLLRGKIVIVNEQSKPSLVRIRIDNPTDPEHGETWDLLLKDKGTTVFVERYNVIPAGEPFYEDPKAKNRKGPLAAAHVVIRQGKVSLQREQVTEELEAPPGDEKMPAATARYYWVSTTGVGKEKMKQVPAYALDDAPLPSAEFPNVEDPEAKKLYIEMRKKFLNFREQMIAARQKLANELAGNSAKLNVALTSLLKSDREVDRILAVRCYGALDKVDALVDALGDPDRVDVRRAAYETLKTWLAYKRDNDYVLFKKLTDHKVYTEIDAKSIIRMLHGFSPQEALTSPSTYEVLIYALNHEKIAIRELAGLQLYIELQKYFKEPVGRNIEYSPQDEEERRIMAVQQWLALLKDKKLPPMSN